jgi:tRNA A-37 threonylcarbamoyl transferase component Bud32
MTTIAGRYQLGEPLGSGGMATVVAAQDLRLDRRVAVKLLRIELDDPAARTRIEREARAAASFSHPNAVTVFDYGEHEGRPYVVMELVDGPSLDAVLRERGPMPAADVRVIGDQLLAALGAAHARGLVHRDVKPANVLCPPGAAVKLADFGIAKAFADAATVLTAIGQVVGTPAYLSPEQVGGQPATPRSDLYATGVVLYEMLAGARPFVAETPLAVAIAHQQAPVPPLLDRRPDLDAGLVAVVEAALAKDPADRPADAEAMRTALASTTTPVERTSVLPLPASSPTVVAPVAAVAAHRRPLALVAAAVAAVALIALAIGLSGGDDPPGDGASAAGESTTTAPPTTAAPTTAAPTAAPSTAAPPPPAGGGPLDGIAGLLALDLRDAGRKGRDLEDRLQEVLEAEDGEDRAEAASRAIEDLEEWVADGDIDVGIAQQALALLRPLAAAAGDDGSGGGGAGDPGNGPGNGNDEDDD